MSVPDQEVLDRASLRLGKTLRDKYTLDRVLGAGGMAVVYKATHRNGKEFAVKVLHAELSMLSDVRARFLREGYVANKVKHPGTVNVIDDDVADDGAAFLVMELLEGQTLEEFWEQHGRKLPVAQVLGLGEQLTDVLAAAHANGIVHRDIKPANLFLTSEGRLKVLDFGIARLRDMATSHATQSGVTMGTPAFMAPEQAMARASDVDGQTDVWSAGATLYTLASGQYVHSAENAQQLLVIAATTPARPIAEVLPHIPPVAGAVIDRALAFEKKNRWHGAAEMRDALRHAQESLRSAASEDAPADGSLSPSAPALDVLAVRASTQPLLNTPPHEPMAEARTRMPGLTTEKPVARDRPLRGAMGRSTMLVPAAALGAVVVIAAVVLMVREGGNGQAGSPPPPVAASVQAEVKPSSTPSSTTVPSASNTAVTVSVDQLPVAPSATATAASKPSTTSAQPVKHANDTKPAQATTAPHATVPKGSCSPPYVIDPATGEKKWKLECL